MFFKIIPEDAGNTLDVVEQQLLRQDHTRGYREHPVVDTPALASSGSSPQMRGAQQAAQKAIDKAGIIPADAESTIGRPQSKRTA